MSLAFSRQRRPGRAHLTFGSLIRTAFLLGAPVWGLLWTACGLPFPPDAKLKRNFNAHQQSFERLVLMAQQDSEVWWLTKDFMYPMAFVRGRSETAAPARAQPYPVLYRDAGPGRGILRERWDQYRALFRELHVTSFGRDSTGIYFSVVSRGLGGGGTSKGYAYLFAVPQNVAESLDGEPAQYGNGHFNWYHELSGRWYLYFSAH